MELFGDSPRALAVSPDASRVYAAIFLSGNQTTVVAFPQFDGGIPQPPLDSPYYDPSYDPNDDVPDRFPTTALIVKFDPASGQWLDEVDHDWGPALRLSLPDQDVFAIDANATPPALLPGDTATGVGTVIYNMAVRPGNGKLFVSNTEAINQVRFEPLIDATHGVQGRFVDNRVTVIDGQQVRPVGLNPHADHNRPTGPPEEVAESIALPTEVTFSPDGRWLYIAAFGSDRIAIADADALEAGIATRRLVRVGGGPAGVVVDGARDRLYVLNRFDQTISIVSPAGTPDLAAETAVVPLGFDPSPSAVTPRPTLPLRGAVLWPRRRHLWQLPRVRRPGRARVGPGRPLRTDHSQSERCQRATLAPNEGADDDAESARDGRGGADALARRPYRGQHRRLSVRRGRSLQAVQPGLRGSPRRAAAADRARDASIHRLGTHHQVSSEPGRGPRPHRDGGRSTRFCVLHGTVRRLPCRSTRHGRWIAVAVARDGCRGRQDPAPAERVRQDRNVRAAASGAAPVLPDAARGRSDPRLRLLPRWRQRLPGRSASAQRAGRDPRRRGLPVRLRHRARPNCRPADIGDAGERRRPDHDRAPRPVADARRRPRL